MIELNPIKKALIKLSLIFSAVELAFFWLMVLVIGMLLTMSCGDERNLRVLPIYGPVDEATKANHTVAGFSLLNQDSLMVSQKDLENKIYVADFFFTTCRSICPKMTTNMQSVYNMFKDNKEIAFVSHSVNPDYDTPVILREYAAKHNAQSSNWFFLTGDKKQIYELARKSYLLDASEGKGDDEDFVHTQNFALVDKQKRIRGYYDGTNPQEVEKLIAEIKILLNENN
jgi:protein SCO1